MKFRLEYLFLKAFKSFFAGKSPEGRVKWGRALGKLWYAVDGKHRRLALENITRSLEVEAPRAEEIARKTFENIALTAAEFLSFGRFEELEKEVTVEGMEHLAAAMEEGKGVFLLAAHWGNWELGAAVMARRVPLTAVVRPMKNPLSDEMINGLRGQAGLQVIGHRGSTRPILKKLGDGEAIGILLDQNTSHQEAVFVPFLGRPAAVNFGLALLAAKTGAPVVPIFMVREEGLRHRLTLGPPVEQVRLSDRREELGVNTARFTAVLEGQIRSHPEQWFWVHNRWKNQPRPGDKVFVP